MITVSMADKDKVDIIVRWGVTEDSLLDVFRHRLILAIYIVKERVEQNLLLSIAE